jgi:threonine dehydrogenase-like Zn-dependent dehydrogenase
MGLKVIGIDVSDTQLEEAKVCGADHTFNPVSDKDYVEKILKLTGGGVNAAVNFTAAKAVSDICLVFQKCGFLIILYAVIRQHACDNKVSFKSTPSKIQPTNKKCRPGEGTLMVVGIPQKPLEINAVSSLY